LPEIHGSVVIIACDPFPP